MPYVLTESQLFVDLTQAYADACRHKHSKSYVQSFELRRDENLRELCSELWNRTYRPGRSSCFLIREPKLREVFAADFRDRIVHHLYFNYTNALFERTFIRDSYSCIKGRGTHDGINRLVGHIRKESQNYTEPCWVLKIDICGYFMHIDRQILLETALSSLRKMASHRVSSNLQKQWSDVLDFDFVEFLSRVIVLYNPVNDCLILGNEEGWKKLPASKSLFRSNPNCGLPIGNLTSQLFSNVYMNVFDQFMKREMHCVHYGRYVDDAYVVSCDREWLLALVPQIRKFLKSRLGLSLQEGKTTISNVRYGVAFLGAFLKPYRNYVLNTSLDRMMSHLDAFNKSIGKRTEDETFQRTLSSTINSFLGVLSHYASFGQRRLIVKKSSHFYSRWGSYIRSCAKFVLYPCVS